jgi:hypothetical protein
MAPQYGESFMTAEQHAAQQETMKRDRTLLSKEARNMLNLVEGMERVSMGVLHQGSPRQGSPREGSLASFRVANDRSAAAAATLPPPPGLVGTTLSNVGSTLRMGDLERELARLGNRRMANINEENVNYERTNLLAELQKQTQNNSNMDGGKRNKRAKKH